MERVWSDSKSICIAGGGAAVGGQPVWSIHCLACAQPARRLAGWPATHNRRCDPAGANGAEGCAAQGPCASGGRGFDSVRQFVSCPVEFCSCGWSVAGMAPVQPDGGCTAAGYRDPCGHWLAARAGGQTLNAHRRHRRSGGHCDRYVSRAALVIAVAGMPCHLVEQCRSCGVNSSIRRGCPVAGCSLAQCRWQLDRVAGGCCMGCSSHGSSVSEHTVTRWL